jgi:hypothetical protein
MNAFKKEKRVARNSANENGKIEFYFKGNHSFKEENLCFVTNS